MTNATTTQFFDPQAKRLGSRTARASFDLPARHPGAAFAARHEARSAAIACCRTQRDWPDVQVVLPGTHDTASAVVAVPAASPTEPSSPTGATSAAAPGR